MKRIIFLASLFLFAHTFALAQTRKDGDKPDLNRGRTLYTVGYVHLDTQWNWDYTKTIDVFLKRTLERNFDLFEKYPDYIFTFTGARRYRMMKEYYPDLYAKMLWQCERTVYTNVAQQKTPRIIKCTEKQRLSLQNLFAQVDGFMPVCWADKDLDLTGVEVLDTVSPYVADKVQIVKHQIWNEALTFLGIENANTDKKERMVSDEVLNNMGDVEAQRFTRLNARKQFCKEVNELFGLDIDVEFRTGTYIKGAGDELEETGGMETSDDESESGQALWKRIKKALKGGK